MTKSCSSDLETTVADPDDHGGRSRRGGPGMRGQAESHPRERRQGFEQPPRPAWLPPPAAPLKGGARPLPRHRVFARSHMILALRGHRAEPCPAPVVPVDRPRLRIVVPTAEVLSQAGAKGLLAVGPKNFRRSAERLEQHFLLGPVRVPYSRHSGSGVIGLPP